MSVDDEFISLTDLAKYADEDDLYNRFIMIPKRWKENFLKD